MTDTFISYECHVSNMLIGYIICFLSILKHKVAQKYKLYVVTASSIFLNGSRIFIDNQVLYSIRTRNNRVCDKQPRDKFFCSEEFFSLYMCIFIYTYLYTYTYLYIAYCWKKETMYTVCIKSIGNCFRKINLLQILLQTITIFQSTSLERHHTFGNVFCTIRGLPGRRILKSLSRCMYQLLWPYLRFHRCVL